MLLSRSSREAFEWVGMLFWFWSYWLDDWDGYLRGAGARAFASVCVLILNFETIVLNTFRDL